MPGTSSDSMLPVSFHPFLFTCPYIFLVFPLTLPEVIRVELEFSNFLSFTRATLLILSSIPSFSDCAPVLMLGLCECAQTTSPIISLPLHLGFIGIFPFTGVFIG
jgi:hypothetical protein